MTTESKALEPMCALDPLLLIPRIEYVGDVYEFVLAQSSEYCLVILDMRNFHVINDLYSYDTGDTVIEKFTQELRRRLPCGSVSLRFRHGDEFLFFVPGSTAQAESLFTAFREVCEATPTLKIAQDTIFVSYRFAVVNLVPSGESVKALLARSERALREIKGQGSSRS